ncbi:MAG: asparagine synthase-related protein, partial [Chloroflexota bacterium]|nr:asparagine synthase-related protein [Chloroflexota bacterium]
GAWMTGALRDLVYDSVVRRGGAALPYFELGVVQRLVEQHDAGAAERALQVWELLTFYLWHDQVLTASPRSWPDAVLTHSS